MNSVNLSPEATSAHSEGASAYKDLDRDSSNMRKKENLGMKAEQHRETLSGRAVVCLEQLGDKSSCDAMQRTAEDIRAKSNQRLRSRAG
ncbi:hypothetical protein NQZ68_018372 [Dissostichus eleginoides]|nr:hypothetical protein NQZ68_018372 [Dissostichus eleginoides]